MAENMYIEVSDRCIYRCATCPKGRKMAKYREKNITSQEVIERLCEARKARHISSVTLSGGEPLLNPNIFEIIKSVDQMGCKITILSNSFIAAEEDIAERLAKTSKKISIVTAVHSHVPNAHDKITGVDGSLKRSLDGVARLLGVGIPVAIKIILWEESCRDLLGIFQLIRRRFGKSVRIVLSGMDLCGMSLEQKKEYSLNFEYQSKMVEEFLTEAEAYYGEELDKYVYISEYPLCRVDPYFWKCVQKYKTQLSSHMENNELVTREYLEIEHTCFPHSKRCDQCVAKSICPGIWYSVYEYLGDDVVIPYQ